MLITATAIWGASYPATKYALRFVPPFSLAFIRYGVAALVLVPCLRGARPVERADRRMFILLGLTGSFCFVSFMNLGMGLTTGVAGSLLSGSPPLITALLALHLLREPLRAAKIAGLALGVMGIVCVAGAPIREQFSSSRMICGNAIILLAQVSWALYTVIGKRAAGRYPGEVVVAWTALIGSAFLLPFALAEVGLGYPFLFTRECCISLVYLALINTALAYFLWNRALRFVGASTAASFQYIQPLSGAAVSVLFLGEAITPVLVAGAALIMAGVSLVLRSE
jgi:drug/metabolite transporter (DMT)-like permease